MTLPAYHGHLTGILGAPVVAMMVVGYPVAREGADDGLLAWMDLSAAGSSGLALFAHALDMERAYAELVLDFNEGDPPVYAKSGSVGLDELAGIVDISRIILFVAQLADGVVVAQRGYEGIDITHIEQALDHQKRFIGILSGRALATPHGSA